MAVTVFDQCCELASKIVKKLDEGAQYTNYGDKESLLTCIHSLNELGDSLARVILSLPSTEVKEVLIQLYESLLHFVVEHEEKEAVEEISSGERRFSYTLVKGNTGRPRIQLDLDKIRDLKKAGVTLTKIAKTFGVCRRTIYRIIGDEGILPTLNDEELHDMIVEMKEKDEPCSQRYVARELRTRGFSVPRSRVRKQLRIIKTGKTDSRAKKVTGRRKIRVKKPNYSGSRDILLKLKSLNEASSDCVEEDEEVGQQATPNELTKIRVDCDSPKNSLHNDCKALYGDKEASSSISDKLREMFSPCSEGPPAKKIRNLSSVDNPAEMTPSPSCHLLSSEEEDADSFADFSFSSGSTKKFDQPSNLPKRGSKLTSSYQEVDVAGTSRSVGKLIFNSNKENDFKDEYSRPADAVERDADVLGDTCFENVEIMSVIEISDNEEYVYEVLQQLPDEELSSNVQRMKQENQDFQSAQVALQEEISNVVQAVLVVDRGNVFQSAVIGFKKTKLNPLQVLNVKFADELNLPEPAVDAGGPEKEFFRLAFQEVRNGSMFEGPAKEKDLTLDYDSLRNQEYKWFGVLCALAIAYKESPVPNFFSEELYNLIIRNKYERELTTGKVAEMNILYELEFIKRCSSVIELKQVAERSAMLSLAGISTKSIKNLARKEKIIEDCLDYYLNERMQPAFSQLLEGLKTLGLLSMMQQNPCIFKDAFVFRKEPVCT